MIFGTDTFNYGVSSFNTQKKYVKKIFKSEDSFNFNMADYTGGGCSSGITGNLCGATLVKKGMSFDEFIKCKSGKTVSPSNKTTSAYTNFKDGYETGYSGNFGESSPNTSNIGCNSAKTGCKCGSPNIKNCDPEVTVMDFSKCECADGSAKSSSNTCKVKACMDTTALNYANPNYPSPNPNGTDGWTDCATNFQGRCYISDSSMCVYSDDEDNNGEDSKTILIVSGIAVAGLIAFLL